MSKKGSKEGAEWMWLGSFFAFAIIGLFWGGVYCYNKFESTIIIIIGSIVGGFIGIIVGGSIGDLLDSLIGNEAGESKYAYQNNKLQEEKRRSSTSAGSSKSGSSNKSSTDSNNTRQKTDSSGSSSSSGGYRQSQEKSGSANKGSTPNADLYQKYYTLLESRPQDDMNTIKNNYRRLVRQYHPDHLGPNASEAMHKYAKEMSQKVNEAYEIIKKHRGIK